MQPGDTIWLRAGTYRGNFSSHLQGSAGREIVVRGYPGEWPILRNTANTQQSILDIGPTTRPSKYAIYRDFEIYPNSANPNRVSSTYYTNTSFPSDIWYGDGVDMAGADHCKLVHLVVHDCFNGFGSFGDSTNIDIIGSVIYYNGWRAIQDGGHGHSLYLENSVAGSVKNIVGNVSFDDFSMGTQVYGTVAFDKDVHVNSNVFATAGKIMGSPKQNVVLGGMYPFENSASTTT